MKAVKRITATVIIIALTFSLCACGVKSRFMGEWTASTDMTEILTEGLKVKFHELEDFIDTEDIYAVAELMLNGADSYSLKLKLTEASAEKLEAAVIAAAKAYVEDYYSQAAEMLDTDLDGLRALYKLQGMDADAEMNAAVERLLAECDTRAAAAEILKEYESEGSWEADGTVIRFIDSKSAEHEFTYSDLADDGFTLTAGTDFAWAFPLAFTKK